MGYTIERQSDHAARTVTLSVTDASDITVDDGGSARLFRVHELILAYGWNGWMFELAHVVAEGRFVLGSGRAGARKCTRVYQVLTCGSGGAPQQWVENDVPPLVRIIGIRYADPDNPTE